MSKLNFKLIQQDGKARAGILEINDKEVLTPTFMPVATKGALKSTPHEMLNKTSVLLANTYHLFLRPGANVVNELGGLHKFMNWDKLILTDSGGFQGWSSPTKKTTSLFWPCSPKVKTCKTIIKHWSGCLIVYQCISVMVNRHWSSN